MSHIDRVATTIAVRTADGTEETYRFADRAAKDTQGHRRGRRKIRKSDRPVGRSQAPADAVQYRSLDRSCWLGLTPE